MTTEIFNRPQEEDEPKVFGQKQPEWMPLEKNWELARRAQPHTLTTLIPPAPPQEGITFSPRLQNTVDTLERISNVFASNWAKSDPAGHQMWQLRELATLNPDDLDMLGFDPALANNIRAAAFTSQHALDVREQDIARADKIWQATQDHSYADIAEMARIRGAKEALRSGGKAVTPEGEELFGEDAVAFFEGLELDRFNADFKKILDEVVDERVQSPVHRLIVAAAEIEKQLVEDGSDPEVAREESQKVLTDWFREIDNGADPAKLLRKHRDPGGVSISQKITNAILWPITKSLEWTLHGAANLVAQFIQIADTAGAGVVNLGQAGYGPITGGSNQSLGMVDMLMQGAVQEHEELLADLRAEAAVDDSELYKKYAFVPLETAIETIKLSEPGVWAEYLKAGGDEAGAIMLLSLSLQDQEPMQEQIQATMDAGNDALDLFIQQLEESDFTLTDTIMKGFATYGEFFMFLAAGLAAMTDPELRDDVMFNGEFSGSPFSGIFDVEEFWRVAQEQETPAKALGIDGTIGGLTVNLAGPAIIDPTNWFIAPAAVGRISSKSAANAASKHGALLRWMKDIHKYAGSPSRAGVSSQALIQPFEAVGLGDRIRAFVSGINENAVIGRKWSASVYGHRADEVGADFIDSLLDDVQREATPNQAALDAVAGDGPAVPIRVSFNSTTRTFAIENSDDLAIIAAAKAADVPISKLPVSIQIVEEFKTKVTGKSLDDLALSEADRGAFGNTLEDVLARTDLDDLHVDDVLTLKPSELGLKETAFGSFDEAAASALMEEFFLRGGTLSTFQHGFIRRMTAMANRKLLESKLPLNKYLHSMFTKFNTTKVRNPLGPEGFAGLYDEIAIIFADDPVKASFHTAKLQQLQDNLWGDPQKYSEILAAKKALDDLYDSARSRGYDPNFDQTVFSRMDLFTKELSKLRPSSEALQEIQTIVREMYDDFNRNTLAHLAAWKKYVDPETGLVPYPIFEMGVGRWKRLSPQRQKELIKEFDEALSRKSRPMMPDEMATLIADEIAENGVERILKQESFETMTDDAVKTVSPEQLTDFVNSALNGYQNQGLIRTPVSMMDLMAAQSLGKKSMALFDQYLLGRTRATLAETFKIFNITWVLDHILRPSTFMTIAMDELITLFRVFPLKTGAWNYTKHRGINMAARAERLAGRRPGPRLQKAIDDLKEPPSEFAALEQAFDDVSSSNWSTITPDNVSKRTFRHVARTWTGSIMQHPLVQNYFTMTKAEFHKWYDEAGGEAGKIPAAYGRVKDPTTGKMKTVKLDFEEFYEGVSNFVEHGLLHGPDKAPRREIWLNTINKTIELGNPQILPDWVLDSIPAVKGVAATSRTGLHSLYDWAIDVGLVRPQTGRRKHIGNAAYETERARLKKLFADQDKVVLPDEAVAEVLNVQGKDLSFLIGGSDYYHELARRAGLIPESYLNKLALAEAKRQIDHGTFMFGMRSIGGSRVGSSGGIPFISPYFDMWARWGREAASSPTARDWTHKIPGMSKAIESLPFNPRPIAALSRLSATELEVGEVDFSSAIFLPTKGENIWYSVIPGIGWWPLGAADLAFSWAGDDAQDLKDKAGEFIQGLNWDSFGQPAEGVFERFYRGGNLANITIGASAFVRWVTGIDILPTAGAASLFGDDSYGRKVSQHVRTEFAESVREMLVSDPEQLAVLNEGIVKRGERDAAFDAGVKTKGTRFIVPVNMTSDQVNGEIDDYWIGASEALAKHDLDWLDIDLPASRRDAASTANSIRNAYHELPGWQQDMIIGYLYPELASNVIGRWQWSDKAPAKISLENEEISTIFPYHYINTEEGAGKHGEWIERGWLQEIPHAVIPELAFARIAGARGRLHRQMYVNEATRINDILWNGPDFETARKLGTEEIYDSAVTDSSKRALQDVLDTSDIPAQFGIKTVKDLWLKWPMIEEWVARGKRASALGLDFWEVPDEFVDDVVSALPHSQRAWGVSYRLDPEKMAGRWKDISLFGISEDTKIIADAIGIDLEEGMTGFDFMLAINKSSTSFTVAIDNYAALDSLQSLTRSANSRAWSGTLLAVSQSYNFSEDARFDATAWMSRAQQLADAKYTDGGIAWEEEKELKEDFVHLKYMFDTRRGDTVIAWDSIWNNVYRGTFGDLDLEPPTARTPLRRNGEEKNGTYIPTIHKIIDGDSLIVSYPDSDSGDAHQVRLLGVFAPEATTAQGPKYTKLLEDALKDAEAAGQPIYLVRDPDFTRGRRVDAYGRELAWLWIGDSAYIREETLGGAR